MSTALTAALAWLAAGSGLWLAGHHPLWPLVLLIGFAAWTLAVAYWPRMWLLLVPASLPLLNFLPWSGWLVFEEFDLLLLGVVAGGYLRRAVRPALPAARAGRRDWVWIALLLGLAVSGCLSFWRGVADAGGWSFGWFDGYTTALNSVRVFKSLVYAVLMAPLVRDLMRGAAEHTLQWLAWGVLAGLTVVCLAVLWERYAFPGWFDFSSPYRTTALFWEMHVGGAAIDAHLAMSLPFLVWALVAVRRPVAWALVAVLAVVAVYAVLTTFSRGVYLAVALPVAGLALFAVARPQVARPRPPGWKQVGAAVLGAVLLAEAATVLLAGSYMGQRLGVADRDLTQRLAHWRHGLALLSTPADWLLGIGLGRLPTHYARQVAGGEFSGSLTWQREPRSAALAGQASAGGFARLHGPASNPSLAAWYGLARRVDLSRGQVYRVDLDLRAPAATELAVRVCERHLLFEATCQQGLLRVGATAGAWRRHGLTLTGPTLDPGAWFAPKLGLLSLSVLRAGASVDLASISLSTSTQPQPATVGDFADGLSPWFAAAQVHFLPWHIDSLLLELLIERGCLGLLLTAAALAAGLWAATRRARQGSLLAGTLAAGLAGGVLAGVWVSIMDVPRVAFLLFLLTLCALAWQRRENSH